MISKKQSSLNTYLRSVFTEKRNISKDTFKQKVGTYMYLQNSQDLGLKIIILPTHY